MLSPEKMLFEGPIKAVSCHNPKGYFDVLQEHTNFMSMVDEKVDIVKLDGSKESIKIETALIHVQENEISILVNIATSQKSTMFQNIMKHVQGRKEEGKEAMRAELAAEPTDAPSQEPSSQ